MIKKYLFEKKYPLLEQYILDENVRSNMIKNFDLMRKYDACEDSIRIFIYELNKYFDKYTIEKMLLDTVLKLPDNVLLSFIQAYLESEESVKCNPDVLVHYNKAAQFGVDAIKYMETNGIIVGSDYKKLPEILKTLNSNKANEIMLNQHKELNRKFKSFNTEKIIFNGEALNDIFFELKIEEKEYVIDLLSKKNFDLFIDLFSRFDYNFETIISLLTKNQIDSVLINYNNLDVFSMYELMILLYELLDYDKPIITINVKKLIKLGKISLVRDILIEDCIVFLEDYSEEELEKLTSEEVMERLVREKALRREA